jgi:hypothetical protein
MVMEATQGGIKITPFSQHEGSTIKVFTPKYPLDAGLAKAVDWLGEGYDYMGLFGMAWVEFGRWLGRKWRNPLRSSKTMFCSEFVVRVMQEVKYVGAMSWDSQSTDPEVVFEFFEKEQTGP